MTAPGALSWYRGHSPGELVAAVKAARPELLIRAITPGRIVWAGGDGPVEAWRDPAAASWLVGDPADLRRACDGAALQVVRPGLANSGSPSASKPASPPRSRPA